MIMNMMVSVKKKKKAVLSFCIPTIRLQTSPSYQAASSMSNR